MTGSSCSGKEFVAVDWNSVEHTCEALRQRYVGDIIQIILNSEPVPISKEFPRFVQPQEDPAAERFVLPRANPLLIR